MYYKACPSCSFDSYSFELFYSSIENLTRGDDFCWSRLGLHISYYFFYFSLVLFYLSSFYWTILSNSLNSFKSSDAEISSVWGRFKAQAGVDSVHSLEASFSSILVISVGYRSLWVVVFWGDYSSEDYSWMVETLRFKFFNLSLDWPSEIEFLFSVILTFLMTFFFFLTTFFFSVGVESPLSLTYS